jgi:hypothetical protein
LRADETYALLAPRTLAKLKRLIGHKTTMIDICGTEPTKPTVLIVSNEGEGPKRFNRRATILLRGVPPENDDMVFGDALITQFPFSNGRIIRRAAKADPAPHRRQLDGYGTARVGA